MASSLSGTISAKFDSAIQSVKQLADGMGKLAQATLRHNTAAAQNAQQLKATRQETARLKAEHAALKESLAPVGAAARYAGEQLGGMGRSLGTVVTGMEEASAAAGKYGTAIGGVTLAAAAFKIGMDIYNAALENQKEQVKAAIDLQYEFRDAILGAQDAQQKRSAGASGSLAERRKTEGLNPDAEKQAESISRDPANGISLDEARQGINALAAIKDPTIRNRAIDAAMTHHQAGGDFAEGARTIAESRGLWGRLGHAGGSEDVAGMLLQKDRNGLLYSGTPGQRRAQLSAGIAAVEGDPTTAPAYAKTALDSQTTLENEGRAAAAVGGAKGDLVAASTPNAKLWTDINLKHDKQIQILQATYDKMDTWFNRLVDPFGVYAARRDLNQAQDRYSNAVLGTKQ